MQNMTATVFILSVRIRLPLCVPMHFHGSNHSDELEDVPSPVAETDGTAVHRVARGVVRNYPRNIMRTAVRAGGVAHCSPSMMAESNTTS